MSAKRTYITCFTSVSCICYTDILDGGFSSMIYIVDRSVHKRLLKSIDFSSLVSDVWLLINEANKEIPIDDKTTTLKLTIVFLRKIQKRN